MSTPFQILFVCKANIARSYAAESFLMTELHQLGITEKEVRAQSRGTEPSTDEDSLRAIKEILGKSGATSRPHEPQAVSKKDLENADLILVAEAGLEERLVEISPSSANRTFTLIEFARLAADNNGGSVIPTPEAPLSTERPQRLREKLAVIARYRGYLPPEEESEDIPDPAGQSLDFLVSTLESVREWTRPISKWCARA